jgi:hypothetical protein
MARDTAMASMAALDTATDDAMAPVIFVPIAGDGADRGSVDVCGVVDADKVRSVEGIEAGSVFQPLSMRVKR